MHIEHVLDCNDMLMFPCRRIYIHGLLIDTWLCQTWLLSIYSKSTGLWASTWYSTSDPLAVYLSWTVWGPDSNPESPLSQERSHCSLPQGHQVLLPGGTGFQAFHIGANPHTCSFLYVPHSLSLGFILASLICVPWFCIMNSWNPKCWWSTWKPLKRCIQGFYPFSSCCYCWIFRSLFNAM